MMKLLSDDEVSFGSVPHIFIDDSGSSTSDTSSSNIDATKPATPHIFLAYARKSCGLDIGTQLQSSISRTERKEPSDKGKAAIPPFFQHRDNTPTAHLFLSFAGNNVRDEEEDDECIVTQAGEDTCETTERKLLLDWGSSMDSFQSRCRDYMIREHHLLPNRADAVAFAMRSAATGELPESEVSSKHRNSTLADIIDSVLNESRSNIFEMLEHAQRDKQSMRQTIENKSKDSILRTLERQEEELSFLRLALKHLILPTKTPIGVTETVKPPSFIAYNAQRSSPFHQLTGYHYNHDNLDERQARGKERTGIPSIIELRERRDDPPEGDTDMDALEIASQLTPSLGDFDSPCYPQEKILRQMTDGLNSSPELSKLQAGRVPWQVQSHSQLATLTVEKTLQCTSTRTGLKSHVNKASYLNISHTVGNECSSHQLSSCEESVADTASGESRDQRARNVDFSIRMNGGKSFLKGKYSGKLSIYTGLPHGPGVFRFENRDLYIGEFENGMFHGTGTLFTRRNRNLIKLRGNFHNNNFTGEHLLLQEGTLSDGVSV